MHPPNEWASCAAPQPAANIEIKARLASLDLARQVASELATDRLPDQRQIDTYFVCGSGRLKLREINGVSAQLIWYERPDQAAAKPSRYVLAPVDQSSLVKNALSGALGVKTTVEKRREIYMFHNVRIHLDEVRQLGYFLEFEAVMSEEHDSVQCHRTVARLRERFEIADQDLCPSSYSDMLLRGENRQPNH